MNKKEPFDPFYSIKLGDKFFFEGDQYMKVELYDNYPVAVNLRTFKIRYFHASERGVTIKGPAPGNGGLKLVS